jgi:hypothetical protein
MNIRAALISTALGTAFFAVGYTFYIQPPAFITDYVLPILSPNHAKARAAVSRLLLNPASAQFAPLRTVEVKAEKYVCGNVNAKDESGSYAGYYAFVYSVAIDFARIDDEGRISQKHAAFSACPATDEEKLAQQKMAISPGALALVKAIQKTIPASDDTSPLSQMASQMSAPDNNPSGASMQQQLGQLAGDPVPEGSRGGTSAPQASKGGTSGREGGKGGKGGTSGTATSGNTNENDKNESEWRADRPPAAWPTFPPDHPLGRPAAILTPAQAIGFAKDVEDRWEESKSGNAKVRPSSEEIREACRALLAIDPKNDRYPKAWAAFVRLRKIDRDAG